MIPAVNIDLSKDFQIIELPTRTFKISDGNTISGFADKLDAMKQAVYLILNTERYEYLIYSWNYGIELVDLYGQQMPFVLPELKRRITEALTQDSRITGVSDFVFDYEGRKIRAAFRVSTIYGDIDAEKAVTI
ncbi:MAG: DUF2634 domain-containing protein [Bacillota bacterium]|nr:DUF2634 domain-containing protein [Bacillota bacterium]